MDVTSTQYLLGVRPTLAGLVIDPCIPPQWSRFTVHRRHRGCRLTITVNNPHAVGKGVAEMDVDGVKLSVTPDALIVPEILAGKHQATVTVTMGQSNRPSDYAHDQALFTPANEE
jgi:cellobiose phosphorylase